MNYKELIFTILAAEDHHRDLLIQNLADIGFETFEELDLGFKAYIPSSVFNQDVLNNTLEQYYGQVALTYEINLIPYKNWNEVWENNFQPITIGNLCYVRATFHEPNPDIKYEIIIDPKMAFGTGHHQTTAMMMELLIEELPAGKNVLDMGCGSGILAILASKLDARSVIAIDNDRVCCSSTRDNAVLNQTEEIQVLCGSAEVIPVQKFDLIMANINRNILIDQLDRYASVTAKNGLLLVSGFYEGEDLEMIKHKALKAGLKYDKHITRDNWVAVVFRVN